MDTSPKWASTRSCKQPSCNTFGNKYRTSCARKCSTSTHKAWVENVEFNVMTESPQQTIAKLRQTLKQMGMAQQVVKLRWTWLSPCCRTFSRMDWINRKHGCFRNHSKLHKPPLKPRSTEKGRLAAVADTMVQRTLALWDHCMHLKRVHMGCSSQYVAQEIKRHGIFLDFSALHMAMENPVGAMTVQRYIQKWMQKNRKQVKQAKVDYCAWKHPYMKPTHIWTTKTHWQPKGTTQNGRCGGKCQMRDTSKTKRGKHKYALGQSSQQMKAGRGRIAMKAAVPVALHQEIYRA